MMQRDVQSIKKNVRLMEHSHQQHVKKKYLKIKQHLSFEMNENECGEIANIRFRKKNEENELEASERGSLTSG